MLVGYALDLVDPGGEAVEVGDNDDPDVRVEFEGFTECLGVHAPGVVLCVDEDGFAVLVDYGVYCGVKCHVGTENLLSEQHALSLLRGAVESEGCELDRHVKGRGAGGEADCVVHAQFLCDRLLEFVDVLARGCDPVLRKRVFDKFQLLGVHVGAGEQYFLLERNHVCISVSDQGDTPEGVSDLKLLLCK